MLQVSLGQTEYLSSYGTYYYTEEGGAECAPSDDGGNGPTSGAIETNLFSGGDIITTQTAYDMCIERSATCSGYLIKATNGKNNITLDYTGTWGEF